MCVFIDRWIDVVCIIQKGFNGMEDSRRMRAWELTWVSDT